ncbi:MAG TPA: ATP-binding cassette domain-containing protein [Dehalococcoidia bacterium]|nr:ATP-binding cassette domain-containing protein [Dehalococcoidia bacterium]
MTSGIRAEALVKHFTPEIRAVDGIDLSIDEGKIFGYLGANGSGKTTTVRMLTTLLRPTSGHAEVAGLDVVKRAQRVRRTVGVALQEAGLDDLQTGRELLYLQGQLFGLNGRKLEERVAYLVSVVDLEDAADRRVGTYSGGMKRRLDLAAALVHDPKILFLDEPTTGLDPISREAIWKYIMALNHEQGVTVFLTTQYLEEADRLADDVAIIDRGKIIATGSPEELKASIGTDVITARIEGNEEDVRRAHDAVMSLDGAAEVRVVDHAVVVYIREGARHIAPMVLKLTESGVSVGEVTLSRPTLDDVFLRKTGHHLDGDGQSAAESLEKQH